MDKNELLQQLKNIIDTKNYSQIKSTFTLQERLFLLNNIEVLELDVSVSAGIDILSNFLFEKEAKELYVEYKYKNKTQSLIFIASIANLSLENKEKELQKIDSSDERYIYFLLFLPTDELKIPYLDKITDNWYKARLIRSFTNDELKIQCLSKITDDKVKVMIAGSLSDDKLKIRVLDTVKNEIIRTNIIKIFVSDELKIQYLDTIKNDKYKAVIVRTVASNQLKMLGLALMVDDVVKVDIIREFIDDDLKIRCLSLVNSERYKVEVIKSMKSGTKIWQQFNLITDFKLVIKAVRYLELTENNVLIPSSIITKYSQHYNVDANRLNILLQKFGYKIFRYLLNQKIKKLLLLNDEDFFKCMEIFSDENIKLNKSALNDVASALLQRMFRYDEVEIYSIFSILEQLIQNKDSKGIKTILNTINQTISLEVFLENELSIDDFIKNLLEQKGLDILHKITNEFIAMERVRYVNERIKLFLEKNSSLIIKDEKRFNTKQIVATNSKEYLLNLIENIDDKYLTEKEKNLRDNRDLLIELIDFKKGFTKNANISNLKDYFKTFENIFSVLYREGKLNKFENNVSGQMKGSFEYLINILLELDFDKLRDKLFNNEVYYKKLLEVFDRYKLLGCGSVYDELADKAHMSIDNSTIASLIDNFYSFYPKLEKRMKNGNLKKITVTSLLEYANVYGSNSFKYLLLFGRENYELLCTNPPERSAAATKEVRLAEAINYVKFMYERDFVTVPPIETNIKLVDKEINVVVGNISSMDNFTLGERTGSCMRIRGSGSSLFDFCLKNKNGFHIVFKDPDTGEFISRVSGFRNGNTVFLNQLRNSCSFKYKDEEVAEACYKVAGMLVEKSKDSKYPIDNVVVSSDLAMSSHKAEEQILGVVNIKEGFEGFHTDIKNKVIVLASSHDSNKLVPIKLGSDKVEQYTLLRGRINKYGPEQNRESIENIIRIQLIEQILGGIPFEDCNYNSMEENIYVCYAGEDWYYAMDYAGNVYSYIMKNTKRRAEAEKEMEIAKIEINSLKTGSKYGIGEGNNGVKKRG